MKISKSDLTIIVDTREQRPLEFKSAKTIPGTLHEGDYSLEGYEKKVSIERKSLSDLLGSLGRNRDRFFQEVLRLEPYQFSAIVIESDLATIKKGNWVYADIHPNSVIGTLQAISVRYGIPVFFCGNHTLTAGYVEGLLFHFAKMKSEEVAIKTY